MLPIAWQAKARLHTRSLAGYCAIVIFSRRAAWVHTTYMGGGLGRRFEMDVVVQVLRVHRISAAIDCGVALNPDTVLAQIESAIVYGLTAAFYRDITVEDGAVVESNFNDYQMLKLAQMPEVDVEIVNSGEIVGGIGEPGLPPLAPALAKAIFHATGERVRRLPLSRSGFSLA